MASPASAARATGNSDPRETTPMKMTLESTEQITEINGVKCRVWEGTSERGTKLFAFVAKIAVENGQDNSELVRDLQENKPTSFIWPAGIRF